MGSSQLEPELSRTAPTYDSQFSLILPTLTVSGSLEVQAGDVEMPGIGPGLLRHSTAMACHKATVL